MRRGGAGEEPTMTNPSPPKAELCPAGSVAEATERLLAREPLALTATSLSFLLPELEAHGVTSPVLLLAALPPLGGDMPGWTFTFPAPPEELIQLQLAPLSVLSIQLERAEQEEPKALLLGPLLAAALSLLGEEPVEMHWSEGISPQLTLRGEGGCLINLSLSSGRERRWSWQGLGTTDQYFGSGEAPPLSPAPLSISLERWWRAARLAERAQGTGLARQQGEQEIDPSAYLHPTVELAGPMKVGAKTKIWHFSKLLGPLEIGERCSFGQNVVIERGVQIGNNVKVQNNVSIYAGVVLEDDVFCGPSMVFTNVGTPRSHYPRRGAYQETRIGRGASIGANATIVCGHSLGPYAFIGAGAVVTRDIPAYALAYGNPARIRGWACYCGERLPLSVDEGEERGGCAHCGRSYERTGETVSLIGEEAG